MSTSKIEITEKSDIIIVDIITTNGKHYAVWILDGCDNIQVTGMEPKLNISPIHTNKVWISSEL